MQAVAKDPAALQPALLMVVATSILTALGSYLFPSTMGMVTYRYDIGALVGQALISIVMGVGLLYATGYLAEKVFHSKLDMNGYVRVAGHSMIVNTIGILPAAAGIGGLWSLVIFCVLLNKLGKMQAGSIILLLLLEGVVLMVLAGLLVGSGAGMYFGGF